MTTHETSTPVSEGRGRILVIDDEPPIGRALRRMLQRDYEIVLCDSGAVALELLESDTSFDVILCDLMMPEVPGTLLFQRVAALSPGLEERIVFMTGGVFAEVDREFLDTVGNVCVAKPIDRAALRELVAERVAARRA